MLDSPSRTDRSVSGQESPGQKSPLAPGLVELIGEIAGVVGAWCPALSPDGRRIAYVTDRSGLPRLEVAHLDAARESADRAPRRVSGADQEVVSVAWSPDGAWLTYLVSPHGLIRSQLHAVRPDGTDARALAGMDDASTVVAGCWTTIPHTYAFSLADGRGGGADACLVDVESGTVRTVATGGFLAVTSVAPDGRRLLARRGARGRRHLVLATVGDVPDSDPVRVLGHDFPEEGTDLAEDGRFAADGATIFLRTAAGRDRVALGRVELGPDGRPGSLEILAARDDADLESYAVLADGRTAMLVWNVDGASLLEIRDLSTGRGHGIGIGRNRVLPGWSVQPDGRSAVLELSEPTAPRSLFHAELTPPALVRHGVATPAHRIAGLPVPELPTVRLATPRTLRYPAADGLGLHGLLFRSPGRTGPLPTVLLLHGGPESQERPSFSILVQSLTVAGFAVVAPNVRGSSGYGLAFTAMDDGARRESSFADIPATVDYLVAAGISVPGRIGVHGWSYGGYLALVALTRWPEMFACGSSHAGMSDLNAFFAETEPWMAAASVNEYGDPVADAVLLRDLSPLHRISGETSPTLLVHGEQDTNVPVGESTRAHDALLAAGVPTELLLLPGEGHTIVGNEGRVSSTLAIVGWHRRWTA